MLKVRDGVIVSDIHAGLCIENMAMVVDKSQGVVLKFGDVVHSDIKEWFNKAVELYHKSGLSWMADDMVLVIFDEPSMGLSLEEVCTVVNYGMNCHSPKFIDLIGLPTTKLKEELVKLHELGF